MPDLEEVTTGDLIDELERRFDSGVVAVTRKKMEKKDTLVWRHFGKHLIAWGLAGFLQHRLDEALRDGSTDEEEY